MTDTDQGQPKPVEIPFDTLSPEALSGVCEAFVLREGTDYGEACYTLSQKVAHVKAQLERHEAVIVYDPATRSIDIMLRRSFPIERE